MKLFQLFNKTGIASPDSGFNDQHTSIRQFLIAGRSFFNICPGVFGGTVEYPEEGQRDEKVLLKKTSDAFSWSACRNDFRFLYLRNETLFANTYLSRRYVIKDPETRL